MKLTFRDETSARALVSPSGICPILGICPITKKSDGHLSCRACSLASTSRCLVCCTSLRPWCSSCFSPARKGVRSGWRVGFVIFAKFCNLLRLRSVLLNGRRINDSCLSVLIFSGIGGEAMGVHLTFLSFSPYRCVYDLHCVMRKSLFVT